MDVAGGVKVALEKIERCHCDLMLFDVALPDGDEVQLFKRFASRSYGARAYDEWTRECRRDAEPPNSEQRTFSKSLSIPTACCF